MTAQVAERLIYGGNKEIGLFSNPLSLYLKQTGIIIGIPHLNLCLSLISCFNPLVNS